METAAVLRSFNVSFSQGPMVGRSLIFSTVNQRGSLQPYVKASEIASPMTSDAGSSAKAAHGPLEKKHNKKSIFPNGFEALVLEVCDETDIAELKLKVGDFELHLKRDIGTPKAPTSTVPPIISPTTAPPIPSEPIVNSDSVAQSVVPPKSPSPATSPYANTFAKASKLAALEASGSNGYVLVSSPTVGLFRKGRTLKGKKQPPSCKEGDIIKEGQTIGYLDQFGNELPVRSDVAGEVLKVLFNDGEAVGYGDPLVAVLPSFHGIE